MQATATTLDHEQEYTPINSRNKVLVASLIGTAIEFSTLHLRHCGRYCVSAYLLPAGRSYGSNAPVARHLRHRLRRAPHWLCRFGHFGDRVGRKATLVASLLTMGISTVVIGLLPGYATIGIFARCCWRWLDLVRVWA